jgi:hypothetical protein
MAVKTFATDAFQNQYAGAFAATDIQAVMVLPDGVNRPLGSLAAVSISSHRDTFPVTSTASVGIRGITRGHRLLAGTLLFHTLDRSAIQGVDPAGRPLYGVTGSKHYGPYLPDQLPLFDIYLTYVNGEGLLSTEQIYGIAIQDFGKTVSLENLCPMEQYSYLALDYAPLTSIVQRQAAPIRLQPSPAQRRSPRVYGAGDAFYGPEAIAGGELPGGQQLQSLLNGSLPPEI